MGVVTFSLSGQSEQTRSTQGQTQLDQGYPLHLEVGYGNPSYLASTLLNITRAYYGIPIANFIGVCYTVNEYPLATMQRCDENTK